MIVSAFVEAIYFGLGLLLIPTTVLNWFSFPAFDSMGMAMVRVGGGLTLAIGIGCWAARDNLDAARVMAWVMAVAKLLSTVMFAYMILSLGVGAMHWVNAAITGLLFLFNAWFAYQPTTR